MTNVAIDADFLLYQITLYGQSVANLFDEEEGLEWLESDTLEADIDEFKTLVDDLAQRAVTDFDEVGEVVVVISGPGNFRKPLDPNYKAKRMEKTERPERFLRLREWAMKTYTCIPGLEADDVVAWYVRQGWTGVSIDKDLLRGVPGRWYDAYHDTEHYTKKWQADRFMLLQTIMGDATDGIPGIKGYGEKKASKWLSEHGWTWKSVVECYEANGLTEDDAVLTRRLVGMDQAELTDNGWKLHLFERK